MYTLTYQLNERAGVVPNRSYEDATSYVEKILCSKCCGYSVERKTYDSKYLEDEAGQKEQLGYFERGEIVDSTGNKVGFYKIEKRSNEDS